MAKHKPPLMEAFKVRVQIGAANDDCWMWIGQGGGGYGVYQLDKSRDAGGTYRRTRIYAHRLSWQLFKGKIPDGLEVCHRCDVPLCVNPEHLFLGTHAANQADMSKKGRAPRGERQGRAKLTADVVREIMASPETTFTLADRHGVTFQTISDIRRGKTWRHLNLTRSDDQKANQIRGAFHASAVLEEYQVRIIRRMLIDGVDMMRIAELLNVHYKTIQSLRDGRSWKHVT